MRLTALLSFIALLLAACTNTERNIVASPYFDTRAFFTAQASVLQSKKTALEKDMRFGDATYAVTIDTVNWAQELKPFTDIDLLKPAYAGRLKKDSVMISEHQYLLTYASTDERTDLKKVMLTFTNGSGIPSAIQVFMREKNTVYESSKTLDYFTDSMYRIEGEQSVRLAKGTAYSIRSRFVQR